MKNESLSGQIKKFIITRTYNEFASITVNQLGLEFKIDRFKLLRQFKKETGNTIETYILQQKMNLCGFLLNSEADLSVKDVARILGFCSTDYFGQVFKKYYGISPAQFRRCKQQYAN